MESTINILDDDTLIHIFNFLPIIDKVKIERVSKRWRILANKSWSFYSKKLNLSRETWGSFIFGSNKIITKRNDEILQKVLLRCGKYLKSIQLSYYYYYYSHKNNICNEDFFNLSFISKCTNLETVEFKATVEILNILVMNMINNCNKIQEINLRNVCLNHDESPDSISAIKKNLIALCSKNKNLKNINYHYIPLGENFLKYYATNSIKSLILKEIANFDDFEDFYLKLKNVETLKISLRFSENNEKFLETISNNCKNITKLTLFMSKQSYEDKLAKLFSISKLQIVHLKKLNTTGKCLLNLKDEFIRSIKLFKCDQIEVSNLIYVLQKCKNLTAIKFQFSDKSLITDQCLEVISNQTKLEYLHLEKLSVELVTSSSLNCLLRLKNLKLLNLRFCSLVTDSFLAAVSENLLKLVNLNIADCKNVTDKGLSELSKLPDLKHLFITGLKTTFQGLSRMSNLISLHAQRCLIIENKYLFKLIRNNLNLEYLDLFYNPRFDENIEFLTVSNLIISKRCNDKILTIIYGPEDYSLTKKIKFTQYLKVINKFEKPHYYTNKDGFDYMKIPKY